MTDEIKLEVGKKYDLEGLANNPYKLIYIRENNEITTSFGKYVFIGVSGASYSFSLDQITVKEHRELFKNTVEGWVGYYDYEDKYCDNLLDELLQKTTSNGVFSTKEGVFKFQNWDGAKKYRITIEELPEQE
jgi:hypothetical protein